MAEHQESTEETPKPESPPFETIALLLQGGGALGAYEGGVYQALAEANVHPNWVAGISIGAINAALIVGNPRETRVRRLCEFWETISRSPLDRFGFPEPKIEMRAAQTHRIVNRIRSILVVLLGAPSFFTPRFPPLAEFWPPQRPDRLSFYDVTPLKETLERLVDFDRINSGGTRLTVGAVNVRTGAFTTFDTTTHKIDARHILASGSLPPGFPATEIDGEYYWDGGVVSNSILRVVLDSLPRRSTLALQVDVWSGSGETPRDMIDVYVREKDIRYASRSDVAIDHLKTAQRLRHAIRTALAALPDDLRQSPDVAPLASEANEAVYNIVHLIYHARRYEGASKDYDFSLMTLEEHWRAGHETASRALSHNEAFERPSSIDGFREFVFSEGAGAGSSTS